MPAFRQAGDGWGLPWGVTIPLCGMRALLRVLGIGFGKAIPLGQSTRMTTRIKRKPRLIPDRGSHEGGCMVRG
ncbi:MAG TPA: hypothetical protein VJN65_01665 [Bacteroidota bacterium]|nr:hypothetical protein [Bacteroidota bacterium]